MRLSLEVASEAGIVVVRDAGVELPTPTHQDALVRDLERLARAGQVFFLATDDPVRYRIAVYAGEQPPASLDRGFESLGGMFSLEAPTGSVVVAGCDLGVPASSPTQGGASLELRGGRYLLSVMGRRPFSGKRHDEDMVELVGAREWAFVRRADRLGLLGCLPLAVTLVCALIPRWRWLLWYLLPVLAASWLPYLLLKNTPRYKAAERQANEHERTRPHFILTLMPTDQEGLAGGFLRV